MMNSSHRFILASKSPRRRLLLGAMGISFEIRTKDIPEDYPAELATGNVAEYLAEKKALAFLNDLEETEVLIAADTTVVLENEILGKPANSAEATQMLALLSGKDHKVNTGVCLLSNSKKVLFTETTKVHFDHLSGADIQNYIETFRPYDKAGAYGIQDCILPDSDLLSSSERTFLDQIEKPGLYHKSLQNDISAQPAFFISNIKGSYFNVVGLPIERLYHELLAF